MLVHMPILFLVVISDMIQFPNLSFTKKLSQEYYMEGYYIYNYRQTHLLVDVIRVGKYASKDKY